MTAPVTELSELDQQLGAAICACLEAAEAGQSPEEMLIRYPQFQDELQEFFVGRERMQRWTAPLRQIARAAQAPARLATALVAEQGSLGDFRLLREIGRGGMGIVYEAEQLSLGRKVALKVLPLAGALDERQLQRFQNEAQAAASLHHTHIVPVHFVGCEKGVHFYAMQLIAGQSLAELLREWRQPIQQSESRADASTTPEARALTAPEFTPGLNHFRTVARWGQEAAEALEYAHEQGILHRDIKPANLIVDGRSHIWITDFGLAQVQNDTRMTLTGDVLGTLRYMSPEQAQGQRGGVDHRTDLYSLGATLYELLTRQPAFAGDDRQELYRRIMTEEPVPPRRLNAAIPADLETIVLKCLAKEPAERYATAQMLADDLNAYLEDRHIQARRPTLWRRIHKWGQRHKTIVAAALVIATVAFVAGALLLWQQKRWAESAYQTEVTQRQRAEENLAVAYDILEEIYVDMAEVRLPRDTALKPEDREFLQKALRFYEQFAGQEDVSPAVQFRTVTAYGRIGEIHQKLGDPVQAIAAWEKAVALLARLISTNPDRTDYQARLVTYHADLGGVYFKSGDLPHAERTLREGIRLGKQLNIDAPDALMSEHRLGNAYCNLGTVLQQTGRVAESEAMFRNAVTFLSRQVAGAPGEVEPRCDLACAYANLGALLLDQSRHEDAGAALQRARAEIRRLPAESQRDTYLLRLLPGLHLNWGILCMKTNRAAEGKEAFEELARLGEQMGKIYPNVPEYEYTRVMAYQSLGKWELVAGNLAEAERLSARAQQLLEALVASQPTNPDFHDRLEVMGEDFNDLGLALVEQGQYQRAVEVAQRAAKLSPQKWEHWWGLGLAHYRAKNWQKSIDAVECSIKVRNGTNAWHALVLAMAHHQLGHMERARQLYDEEAQHRSDSPTPHPKLVRLRAEAAEVLGIKENPAPLKKESNPGSGSPPPG